MVMDKCDHEAELESLEENVMRCPKCKGKIYFESASALVGEIAEAERALRESLMYLFAVPRMEMPNGVRIGYDSEEVRRGLW